MYTGRFAPSPTGPLHFGSLVAALASFLRARQARGRWLVRMEDIDPPREPPGACEQILDALTAHGLTWDGLSFQSKHGEFYEDAIRSLDARGLIYPCACSRKRIKESGAREVVPELGPVYPGYCRLHPPPEPGSCALRVKVGQSRVEFEDLVQGWVQQDLKVDSGDFVVKRADQLYSYSLAVAVDDARQGITEVIRGADLLYQTPRQIFIMQQLGYETPAYGHVPLVTDNMGQKLSKQSGAPALDPAEARANLVAAMKFLGLPANNVTPAMKIDDLLSWAIAEFDLECLKMKKAKIAPIPV
jgi:glutamyl-Q tRNA(Asp) synthetase